MLVDGVDVRQLPQETLRHLIGFVPQSPVLFSGTVAENIRYGRSDATEAEMVHAARVAQAEEFIQSLAEGYGAPVSQGVPTSPGDRSSGFPLPGPWSESLRSTSSMTASPPWISKPMPGSGRP